MIFGQALVELFQYTPNADAFQDVLQESGLINRRVTLEEAYLCFQLLPENIQAEGARWGMCDTIFKDSAHTFFKKIAELRGAKHG